MCGRFTQRSKLNLLLQQFAIEDHDPHYQLDPRYNIAPSQDVAVVRMINQGQRQLAMLRWGLIPSWADDPKIGYRMINARSDSVATKPSFRTAFKRRRCLIPADGFYEWKNEGKTKQPYLIELTGGELFAFAGLWESWRGADPPIESCTIITTEANELLSELHDRMPVILSPNDYQPWLDPANEDRESLERLLDPYPASQMRYIAVSTTVNNARNEGPECIEMATRGSAR
jgi:putative SOS response-associated peptidase YedK